MNTKSTVRIILTSNSKVLLLQKEEKSQNPLCWEFPGGKLDNHDSITAAKMELIEETGIEAEFDDFCFQDYGYEYTFNRDGEENKRKVIFYSINKNEVPNVTLDKMNSEEDKHVQYKWFSKEEYIELFEKSTKEGFSKPETLSMNSKIEPEKIFI